MVCSCIKFDKILGVLREADDVTITDLEFENKVDITQHHEQNVASSATVSLGTYTVQSSKKFRLLQIVVTGDAVAKFNVKINGTSILTPKISGSQKTETIKFSRYKLDTVGNTVEVQVTNRYHRIAEFSVTIIGYEVDA